MRKTYLRGRVFLGAGDVRYALERVLGPVPRDGLGVQLRLALSQAQSLCFYEAGRAQEARLRGDPLSRGGADHAGMGGVHRQVGQVLHCVAQAQAGVEVEERDLRGLFLFSFLLGLYLLRLDAVREVQRVWRDGGHGCYRGANACAHGAAFGDTLLHIVGYVGGDDHGGVELEGATDGGCAVPAHFQHCVFDGADEIGTCAWMCVCMCE
ncbi:hypothetical protein B484DRAFT_66428 [Ochromonadaceae sp. CCMP2298]|nr:hypothetical protein B484DRAFT_66428 [Ochromonadaceae sp. CCMP2298]